MDSARRVIRDGWRSGQMFDEYGAGFALGLLMIKREHLPMLFVYAALVVFGWWVPNDLLERSPALREFSDFMATFIPQVDRTTLLGGPAGQSNRVIYACLWPIAIVCIPLMALHRFRYVQRFGFELKQQHIPLWQVVTLVPGGLLMAWDAFYLYWFDTSLRVIHFGLVNRFGSALMAPGLVFAPGILVSGVCLLCWGIFTGRIHVGTNRHK